MYVLKIDWSLCEKECIQVCHAIIDRFIIRVENNEFLYINNPEKALTQHDVKLARVQKQCPNNAITFVKFLEAS